MPVPTITAVGVARPNLHKYDKITIQYTDQEHTDKLLRVLLWRFQRQTWKSFHVLSTSQALILRRSHFWTLNWSIYLILLIDNAHVPDVVIFICPLMWACKRVTNQLINESLNQSINWLMQLPTEQLPSHRWRTQWSPTRRVSARRDRSQMARTLPRFCPPIVESAPEIK